MFGLKESGIQVKKDYQTSIMDGYNLLVKYRHVYAGTGNWLKVNNRVTSYSYNFSKDMLQFGNNSRHKKILGKLAQGNRSNRKEGPKWRYKTQNKNQSSQISAKTYPNQEVEKETSEDASESELPLTNSIDNGNQLQSALNEHSLSCNKYELHDTKHNTVECSCIDSGTEKTSKQNVGDVTLSDSDPGDVSCRLINSGGSRLTKSKTNITKMSQSAHKMENISKQKGVHCGYKDSANNNDEGSGIVNRSEFVTEDVVVLAPPKSRKNSNRDNIKQHLARPSKDPSKTKSTRKNMSLLSRLSLEAQAAIKETRSERCRSTLDGTIQVESVSGYSGKDDSRNSTDRSREDSSTEKGNRSTKNVAFGVTEDIEFEHQKIGKSKGEHILPFAQNGQISLNKSTRNLVKDHTFVITPMGYDSRFSDRPLVLNTVDETPQEIREMAFLKCTDWLEKHT